MSLRGRWHDELPALSCARFAIRAVHLSLSPTRTRLRQALVLGLSRIQREVVEIAQEKQLLVGPLAVKSGAPTLHRTSASWPAGSADTVRPMVVFWRDHFGSFEWPSRTFVDCRATEE